MDLSVFYQTTATLAPVLLAGTALAYRHKQPPRTSRGTLAFALFLVVPPLLGLWFSLCVLARFYSPGTWRIPVLLLIMVQLVTGIAGTADLRLVDKEDRAHVLRVRREAQAQLERERSQRRDRRRWKRRRPHKQPHKPDATTGNEPHPEEEPAAPDGVSRT